MSHEHKNSVEHQKKPKQISIKYIGSRALIAAGVAGSAIAMMGAGKSDQPDPATINGPHRVYTAKPGDTEWSIGSRAYPNMNELEAQQLVDAQNSHKNHLVIPGQKFEFGMDSELGKVVDPSDEHLGSGAEG